MHFFSEGKVGTDKSYIGEHYHQKLKRPRVITAINAIIADTKSKSTEIASSTLSRIKIGLNFDNIGIILYSFFKLGGL
jgi:hypothetical protein